MAHPFSRVEFQGPPTKIWDPKSDGRETPSFDSIPSSPPRTSYESASQTQANAGRMSDDRLSPLFSLLLFFVLFVIAIYVGKRGTFARASRRGVQHGSHEKKKKKKRIPTVQARQGHKDDKSSSPPFWTGRKKVPRGGQ